jgi:hypothetical protein
MAGRLHVQGDTTPKTFSDALTGQTPSAWLDVSHNDLTREGLEAIRPLAPEVISRHQDRPGTAPTAACAASPARVQAAEGIADPRRWRDAGVEGDVLRARYRGTERGGLAERPSGGIAQRVRRRSGLDVDG